MWTLNVGPWPVVTLKLLEQNPAINMVACCNFMSAVTNVQHLTARSNLRLCACLVKTMSCCMGWVSLQVRAPGGLGAQENHPNHCAES